MKIDAKHFADILFNALDEAKLTDPSDFNNKVVQLHTRVVIEKICGHVIDRLTYLTIISELTELWTIKYAGVELWAMCCGYVIFRPAFAPDSKYILECLNEELEILERRC